MKKLLKKTLALALATMLTVGAGPLAGLCGLELPSISSFTVSAAEDEPVWTTATADMIRYEGNTITGFTSELSGNIAIPTHINGTAITTIKAGAFENCSALTAVKISENISSIGVYAFQKCDNLKTVYFNSNSCTIPYASGLNSDGAPFAYNNALTDFVFGENVTTIPENVCRGAGNLQNVVFKGTVTEIGNAAFKGCSSLTSVDLANVKTINSSAFYGCTSISSFTLSDELETIGEYAFYDCRMTEVTIPSKVKNIGVYAFQECSNLKTVYFNSNSCTIPYASGLNSDGAPFAYNNALTDFVFGENVTTIPENVCRGAGNLQNAVFKGTVTEIGNAAFKGCSSLTGVDLSNVKTIDNSAFYGCISFTSITFSDVLETIGKYAFYDCRMTEITIPSKVKTIDVYAFQECSNLKTVYFNSNSCKTPYANGLNSDGAPFAYNNTLTEFVFGKNVTTLPDNVCRGAGNLQSVVFDGAVTKIGTNAFYNCTSLSDVYYNEGSEEDWNKVEIKSGNDILSSDDVTIHFGVYPVTETNEEFGVTVSYVSKAFNQEVKLSITETTGEREKGSIAISDREISEQIGCFNIKMILADGSSTAAVQPNGVVTVKMAIPANYIGRTNFKIVHHSAPRENFSTNPKGDEKKLTVSADGKYWLFEVTNFSDFEFFAVEAAPTVSIKNNSGSKTVNYGDILRLTANTSNMPADAKIFWYVDGVKMGEGTTFEVSPESGSVDVTVKVVDASGNDYADTEISDSQKVTVKSGFFQKLINFFKNLFGISRIVAQAFTVK